MPKKFGWSLRALAAGTAIVVLVAVLSSRSSGALKVGLARRPSSPTPVAAAAQLVGSTVPTTTTTVPPTTAPTTTSTAPPSTTVPPPPVPVVPAGKGMWLYEPKYVEGGDPAGIVARAQATGLTHLYVRMGSSVDGFNAAEFLDALLPVAHASGIRVIGWDFPYFDDVRADVNRALEAINYTTPTGDRIDGFSPDIETPAEYVILTPENADAYGSVLREAVGPSYLLIATVPRPSPGRQADYPYAEIVRWFDAIAPMVYWIDQPPDVEAATTLEFLAQYGKPVLPVGQAYDGSLEGGPPGTPTADEIGSFVNAADANGAAGVSFWSWQHASDEMWGAIAAAQEVGVKPSG